MERRADPSIQLEIDEAILDYLLYMAVTVLLGDAKSKSKAKVRKLDDSALCKQRRPAAQTHIEPDVSLQMVDSFLTMFRSMHPDQHGSMELQFRLRLLQFTALFTARFTPSNASPLNAAHEYPGHQPQDLATSYHGDAETVDREPVLLTEALTVKVPGNKPPKPSSSNSLLSTLPHFMALSAAHISLEDRIITAVWMRLAAGYMAQTVIEQCLIYSCQQPEILHKAFAYRFDPDLDAQEGTDEWNVNAMFFGKDDVVEGWEEIRQEHMRALVPPEGWPLEEHLRALLAGELSLSAFEDDVIDFLEGLLVAHPKPVLVQLEHGKVDGVSNRETWALKRAVGWGDE